MKPVNHQNLNYPQQTYGYLFEIQRLSTEDGPGLRTTVFLKGCPLKCKWCHNPESIPIQLSLQWYDKKCIGCGSCIDACDLKALKMTPKGLQINRIACNSCGDCVQVCPTTALKGSGTWWKLEDLYDEVLKDQVYFTKSAGGVTISGGEPTMQLDFVEAFTRKLHMAGIHTALDTCGLSSKTNYLRLLPYIDLILLDIKEIDSVRHQKFTGVSNHQILENAIWLAEELHHRNKQLWIRTPLIPNYTATQENITGIAEFIQKKLHNRISRWDLLAFNNLAKDKYRRLDLNWPLRSIKLFTKTEMEVFHSWASQYPIPNIQWSGLTQQSSIIQMESD